MWKSVCRDLEMVSHLAVWKALFTVIRFIQTHVQGTNRSKQQRHVLVLVSWVQARAAGHQVTVTVTITIFILILPPVMYWAGSLLCAQGTHTMAGMESESGALALVCTDTCRNKGGGGGCSAHFQNSLGNGSDIPNPWFLGDTQQVRE